MHYKDYFGISFICLIGGMLLIAIQKEWIILRFSPSDFQNNIDLIKNNQSCHKKKIKLFVWQNDNWSCEKDEILWGTHNTSNIINLVQSWLTLLEEEKIVTHKIALQSAIISANGQTAYLSFDQNLFSQDINTYQKLMIIEALLKTLRQNHITCPTIQFLVQHKPIKDAHLDFSNPWPINGFL